MRRHVVLVGAAGLVAAGALAAAGSDAATTALRALAVVAVFGLGAALLRRRRAGPGAPVAVSIVERHGLSRDAGLALVSVDGRRLLVGYGPAGVAIVAELDGTTGGAP